MSAPGQTLSTARRVWRALAPRQLRSLAGPVMLRRAELLARAALAVEQAEPRRGPLIVSGLLSESKGISEAARLTVAGLSTAGFDPVAHDVRPALEQGPGGGSDFGVDAPGGVWLLHLNAPEMVHALAAMHSGVWAGRRRIGYWAYELPRLPPLWTRVASMLHEIWVPSRFVADAVQASGVATPVRVMPHPAHLKPAGQRARARFGLGENETVVLAMGDFNSAEARKNLSGAIAIYRQAVEANTKGMRLLVKTQSDADHPAIARRIRQALDSRNDITLLSSRLSEGDIASLIASVDIVLSPHRAEGFGLTLAEAFLSGAPALATGWSGNLDFMQGIPDLLIDYTLRPVVDPSGVYRGGRLAWAEPDMADAVAKLRALLADPDRRRELAAAGRTAVMDLATAWRRETLMRTDIGAYAMTAAAEQA